MIRDLIRTVVNPDSLPQWLIDLGLLCGCFSHSFVYPWEAKGLGMWFQLLRKLSIPEDLFGQRILCDKTKGQRNLEEENKLKKSLLKKNIKLKHTKTKSNLRGKKGLSKTSILYYFENRVELNLKDVLFLSGASTSSCIFAERRGHCPSTLRVAWLLGSIAVGWVKTCQKRPKT